jgi:hypothetical protein
MQAAAQGVECPDDLLTLGDQRFAFFQEAPSNKLGCVSAASDLCQRLGRGGDLGLLVEAFSKGGSDGSAGHHSIGDQFDSATDDGDIALAVAAMTPGGACRRRQAVSTLPRTQNLPADPDPSCGLTGSVDPVVIHASPALPAPIVVGLHQIHRISCVPGLSQMSETIAKN